MKERTSNRSDVTHIDREGKTRQDVSFVRREPNKCERRKGKWGKSRP